jgi:hypothetical protein
MLKEKTKGSEVTIFRQYRQYRQYGVLEGLPKQSKNLLLKKKKKKRKTTLLCYLNSSQIWIISCCRDDQRLHPIISQNWGKNKIKTLAMMMNYMYLIN